MIVRLNKDLCLNVCASKWKSNQQNWYKKSDFFISDAFCFWFVFMQLIQIHVYKHVCVVTSGYGF